MQKIKISEAVAYKVILSFLPSKLIINRVEEREERCVVVMVSPTSLPVLSMNSQC